MLLCIKFSLFHPIIRPSVFQSVCDSALSFLISFRFLESSTGTRSFVLCATTRIMLLNYGQCLSALKSET